MTVAVLLLGALVLALGGCAVVANRFYVPPALEQVDLPGAPVRRDVADLTISTWNIGYAGMGHESDFVYDLGQQRRPLNAGLVDKNLTQILAELDGFRSDIFLFQEAARPSWVTYGRDVLVALRRAFPGHQSTFGADIHTRYVPRPFNIQVGNATFSRLPLSGAERRGLPLEPTFELGIFRKGYRMHIVRLGDRSEWVIVNIHLSTFDTEDVNVRERQVRALLDFAQAEYAQGRHVVIGGDWNLRLADTKFAHNTPERFQFWIRDFPQDLVPQGWSWAVDPATPTVRTAHKPFVAGENYTLVIDGFLVSSNVAIKSVKTRDLGFAATDHHPVTARLAAKE